MAFHHWTRWAMDNCRSDALAVFASTIYTMTQLIVQRQPHMRSPVQWLLIAVAYPPNHPHLLKFCLLIDANKDGLLYRVLLARTKNLSKGSSKTQWV
ncbi:uncharacterized protein N7500_004424 [Penicillium coprophilum]|uniref:uncharacterized protein n=1 Tax=Penicillium coprophilum TaxID=36646 RepID=UPI0023868640|nr:uncharacterized protein N7500_004424 [Penicillium coprophilum]KAJ5162594.1 hypothetical protein N7500_004424 [Penicillium coprophilum]